MRQYRSIAIDGPSGAGKSTLARALAQKLGYIYVDTGAIYRTVGLAAKCQGIDPKDSMAVEGMLEGLEITMGYGQDGEQKMFLNGVDVSQDIRQHVISTYASSVAALPAVRTFLLNQQRDMAVSHNVVMDGRDIGTVVLPQADVKVFLTAAPEDRAHRRYLELVRRGEQADEAQVLRDVMDRDKKDMERSISPLKQAEDAVVVDTTGKTLEESHRLLLHTVKRILGGKENCV